MKNKINAADISAIRKELEPSAIPAIAEEMARKVARAGFTQIRQVKEQLYCVLCAENNFFAADRVLELQDKFALCSLAESMGII